jgi:hypothetical protein
LGAISIPDALQSVPKNAQAIKPMPEEETLTDGCSRADGGCVLTSLYRNSLAGVLERDAEVDPVRAQVEGAVYDSSLVSSTVELYSTALAVPDSRRIVESLDGAARDSIEHPNLVTPKAQELDSPRRLRRNPTHSSFVLDDAVDDGVLSHQADYGRVVEDNAVQGSA